MINKFLILTLFTATTAQADFESCFQRPDLQKVKSARLQEIAAEDQADRAVETIDWLKVTPRDLKRRVEVGEIFALGCFSSAADYAAGATVYQHGDTADHAFQAFIWSKRGVDLGDSSQKWWLGAALDRYLVRIGQKQLFATQYSKPFDETCFCLEAVEENFPDRQRISYVNKSLAQAIARVKEINRKNPGCEKVTYCRNKLKESPQGTIPGFW